MSDQRKRTLAWKAVDNIMVAFHGSMPPSNREYMEYLETWEVFLTTHEKPICLVASAGGGPNAAQRRASAEVAKRVGKEVVGRSRTALLTDSKILCGIVTVFSWLGISTLRAFRQSDLEGALRYVGLDASHKDFVQTTFDELRAQVT